MKEAACNFYKCVEGQEYTRVIVRDIHRLDMDNRESVVATTNVDIERKNDHRNYTKMVLKAPYYDDENLKEFPEFSPDNVLKKYKKLKENGFPVVPTLRYDPENKYFLMTDLTKNGENIIIDKHRNLKNSGVLIKNIDNIRQEIRDTAVRAWNCEMFLSFDAYAVVVNKKTKMGKLYILDIGQTSYEIEHRYCLIYNTEEDAREKAETFLKYCFKR